MGANDASLTVVSVPACSRFPPSPEAKALTGMDIVRLVLERATSAEQAVDVVGSLLSTHGQGGDCGWEESSPTVANVSLLMGDRSGVCWVMETCGIDWTAKRYLSGIVTLSNCYTIGNDFDRCSEGLVEMAIARGLCTSTQDFHWADLHTDEAAVMQLTAVPRCARTRALLTSQLGAAAAVTPYTAMGVLRDHALRGGAESEPSQGVDGHDVCMHAGAVSPRVPQTTGSLVAHLKPAGLRRSERVKGRTNQHEADPEPPTYWLTATAAPCTSSFKPVWLDAFGVPQPSAGLRFKGSTPWWRHEVLHRSVLLDFTKRLYMFATERDAMERDFISRAAQASTGTRGQRLTVTRACFAQADAAARWWSQCVNSEPLPAGDFPLGAVGGAAGEYSRAWKERNKRCSIHGVGSVATKRGRFLVWILAVFWAVVFLLFAVAAAFTVTGRDEQAHVFVARWVPEGWRAAWSGWWGARTGR